MHVYAVGYVILVVAQVRMRAQGQAMRHIGNALLLDTQTVKKHGYRVGADGSGTPEAIGGTRHIQFVVAIIVRSRGIHDGYAAHLIDGDSRTVRLLENVTAYLSGLFITTFVHGALGEYKITLRVLTALAGG